MVVGKSSSHGVLCGEKYGAVLLPKESLRSVVVGESMAESSMELSSDSRSSKRGPGLRSMDSCEEGRRKSIDDGNAMSRYFVKDEGGGERA